MIDLHVHTWRCRHATGVADDYVRAAAATGITVLGFAEHLPLAPALLAAVPGAEGYAMPEAELPAYREEVRAAASLGVTLGVDVRCGVEVDLVPVALEHTRTAIGNGGFDYVLGSIHFIDGWAFDDPDHADGYERWDTLALWERYFADLGAAARTGIADVMAHADLVKKFCRVPDTPLQPLYARVAAELADAGVAVEVNTAGLRKPCRELYPAQALLEEFCRAGVPVTVGSDAHTPGEVGYGAHEARAAIRDAGYRSVLVFRDRVPEEVPLDDL